ncbi:MAG: pantoate--beta-alanine ligase, partial [Rhodothermales bacterium]|nr:pantoate--beta-alanine ligase [Rhodothermales bacterium]
PTQFGPGEDFDAYPRDLRSDAESLRAQGTADVVFAPRPADIYPEAGDAGDAAGLVWVSVDRMGDHLCGASRTGHFRGVTTIVTKLLVICRPNVAVFGLKDAQQFFIIKRLVRELHLPVQIVGVETVREADGLAMSSRNRYLSEQERREAVALSTSVRAARELIEDGEQRAEAVRRRMKEHLATAGSGQIDYAEIVETRSLQPVSGLRSGTTVLAAVAVRFGDARLIDNAIVDVP